MKKQFTISIDAPKDRVWEKLWSDDSYKQWSAAFMEGSCVETDWKEGSKILFLDSKRSGLVSSVTENKPAERMVFTHLGTIHNGVEDLDSAEARQWSGSTETYTLTSKNGGTELIVDMEGNIPPEFQDYLLSCWPKALGSLKEIAEKN